MPANTSETKAGVFVGDILGKVFEPKALLPIDQWCEKHIRLSKKQSNNSGRYSLTRTPYFRGIYQALDNPKVRKVALKKGAQIGASQMASNVLLYFACNHAVPSAVILPSQELARSFAERNLIPTIETLEPIQALLTGNPDDIRKNELVFKTSVLKILGGGSATKLSSNPICLGIIDEANKFLSQEAKGESDPIELAEARLLSYQDSPLCKLFIGSTPTVEGTCKISALFDEGDQNYFHVPCPHCREFQRLVFDNVVFDHCKEGDDYNLARVEKETYYRCEKCGGRIEEEQKYDLVNGGVWVATNPTAPEDTKSFHISALYSLSLSWGKVARYFLKAKGDRSRLQNFLNSYLGETFELQAASVNESDLAPLIRDDYETGQVPALDGRKPLCILAAADTQQTTLPYIIAAVYDDTTTAIIDFGYMTSFDDWLKTILQRQFDGMPIWMALSDAGGQRTSEVYQASLDSGGRLIPCFGRTAAHGLVAPVNVAPLNFKGSKLPVVNINDKLFTELILFSVFKGIREKLWLPKNVTADFTKQLCAVSIIEKKKKDGTVKHEIKAKRNNHYFDALKYLYGLRQLLLPQILAGLNTQEEEQQDIPPVDN